MADRNSQLPTGSLKQKLIRRFIAAYERQNPGTTVKIAEPRMHLPGGPDPFTYAWEVIAVRPDSTILTALVAAVRPKGKKRTKFVDFTDIHLPGFNPVRLMLVANAMRDLNAHRTNTHGTSTAGGSEIPTI